MPTIIDSLIAVLDLDPSKYLRNSKKARDENKKLKDEVTKTVKGFQEGTKKAVEGFSELKREIVGLFAVVTAGVGLKNFIDQTIQSDAATGRLAHNLGVATEELSAWQGVLKRNGGAAADADSGFQALVSSLEQIQLTGTSPLIPYLNLLKVSLSDLKNPSATLLKIADAFHNMDPRQAAALGQSMGFSPAMISVLEKGRTAVSAMLAEQQKLGVITQADAEAGMRLQNTLSSVAQASATLGRTILTIMAPALELGAKMMTGLAEFAKKHMPIVTGAFIALAVAAGALAIALLADALPFIGMALAVALVGAAIGALVEVVVGAFNWFMKFLRSNEQTRDAMNEVGAAARDLWDAINSALAPLKPIFDVILGALQDIGRAIGDAFGSASLAVAKTFVSFLINQFHALADMIRAITALLHGDFRGALAAAKDFVGDTLANPLEGPRRASRGAPGAPAASAPSPAAAGAPTPGGSTSSAAARMIAGFEGFLAGAKWDRNAFRAGFGSDTKTDPRTGKVTRVTPGTQVSRAEAEADLNRRVQTEFMPKVAAAVGATWSKFSEATKAALTSVAYNYGSLPKSVLAAARSGDTAAIAAAIKARENDNNGINAKRRAAEAAAVLGSPSPANSNFQAPPGLRASARQQYAVPSNDNRAAQRAAASAGGDVSHIEIGKIEIHTRATDAAGIAREIGPAIRQRTYVTQANSGLG